MELKGTVCTRLTHQGWGAAKHAQRIGHELAHFDKGLLVGIGRMLQLRCGRDAQLGVQQIVQLLCALQSKLVAALPVLLAAVSGFFVKVVVVVRQYVHLRLALETRLFEPTVGLGVGSNNLAGGPSDCTSYPSTLNPAQ